MIWPRRTCPQSSAWADHAVSLAQWTRQRLVNREDVWQVYVPQRKRADQGAMRTLVGRFTEKLLTCHYAANDPAQLIALHCTSDSRTARWIAIEVERQGEDDPVTPGVNFQAALQWHEMLQTVGMDPILEQTDDTGGYRLLVLFDEPAAVDQVAAAGRQLVSGYADFGLHCAPRLLPDPDGGDDNAWLRLPGRHPSQNHFSRVWDGSNWLAPQPTIEALLGARSAATSLLHSPRPKVVRRLSIVEPRRKVPKPAAPPDPAPKDPTPLNHNKRTPPAPPQSSATLALTEEAGQSVAAIAQRTGLRDSEIVNRVFDWLVEQDEVVQAVVLGQIPQAIRPDAARLALERLAEEAPKFS